MDIGWRWGAFLFFGSPCCTWSRARGLCHKAVSAVVCGTCFATNRLPQVYLPLTFCGGCFCEYYETGSDDRRYTLGTQNSNLMMTNIGCAISGTFTSIVWHSVTYYAWWTVVEYAETVCEFGDGGECTYDLAFGGEPMTAVITDRVDLVVQSVAGGGWSGYLESTVTDTIVTPEVSVMCTGVTYFAMLGETNQCVGVGRCTGIVCPYGGPPCEGPCNPPGGYANAWYQTGSAAVTFYP
jgi:hypothetical protein